MIFCVAWLCSLATAGNLMAQGNGKASNPKGERIESLRIAYISEKLQLTPDEAKSFWPVYTKMEAEMKDLRKKYKMSEEESTAEEISEQEAEKKLNEFIGFKEAQLALAKKYQAEFRKVISAKKVLLLYRAEEDFKKELLRIIRERRMNKNGGQGPGR